ELHNNYFENIYGGHWGLPTSGGGSTGLHDDPDGTAIFGYNKLGSSINTHVDVQYWDDMQTDFLNSNKGIVTFDQRLSVQKGKFQNGYWGIMASLAAPRPMHIENARMDGLRQGIGINGQPSSAAVRGNKITL